MDLRRKIIEDFRLYFRVARYEEIFPGSPRFSALRELKQRYGNARINLIYFRNVVDGLDYQLEFCKGFCDAIISSRKPEKMPCQAVIGFGDQLVYLVHVDREWVDFGKRYFGVVT